MTALTVVMYHYVRPLAGSAFPRLKALDLADFRGQLDWLAGHHRMITLDEFRAARTGAALPPGACLLTFDDGYLDHYSHVFPLLVDRGIPGLFFAPYQSLIQRRVLEVNKIQMVLASLARPEALAEELDALLRTDGRADVAALRAAHFLPNRYDGAEVAYAKRLLQHALPADLRKWAVDGLFQTHVSTDEAGFAEDLYLTPDQAREMRAAGMEFGGHGSRHLWHGQCSPADLAAEVAGSVAALQAIGAPVRDGFYCYPFGSEGPAVRRAVGQAGFAHSFTTVPAVCDLAVADGLALPRLDTNDLPKSA